MQEPYLSQVKVCNLACSPSCDHQTLPSVGDGISVGTGNSCGMSEATKVRMIPSVVFECVHILAYIYVHIYIVVICKHRYVYIHVWIRDIYYLFSSFGWVVCTVDLCIIVRHCSPTISGSCWISSGFSTCTILSEMFIALCTSVILFQVEFSAKAFKVANI